MSFRSLARTVVAAAALAAVHAWADNPHTLILTPDRDATLFEDPTGSTAAGKGAWVVAGVNAGAQRRRALLHFDVAAYVPTGSTIQSAKLTLQMSRTIATAHNVAVHRGLATWGEGTSLPTGGHGNGGAGGPATAGDATWVHRFFPGTNWATAGGDFAPAASAVQSVDAFGAYSWGSTPNLVADVQLWVNTPAANAGWILIGDETAAATAKRFDSRDNATSSGWPRLLLVFDSPVDVPPPAGRRTLVLYPGVPNPFNPRTTLAYTLPRAGRVRLGVYDARGALVATLVDRDELPGDHVATWDGRDARGLGAASGAYVLRLESGGERRTRTVVLAK